MGLVAERLDHVGQVEVMPEECAVLEFLDSMDGFFMFNGITYPLLPAIGQ